MEEPDYETTLPNDGTSLDTLNNTLERIVKVSLETLES